MRLRYDLKNSASFIIISVMIEKNILHKKDVIDRLEKFHTLKEEAWLEVLELGLLSGPEAEEAREYLYARARSVREAVFGKEVYIRGLMEISNRCKNDCYYCGIRKSNSKVSRYWLRGDQILHCAKNGYELGFRTFVLQGGEDAYYTDEVLTSLLRDLKQECQDAAVTLSLGERSAKSYQRLFDAGADRYLLRHETASPEHYQKLHPKEMSWERRIRCLWQLREIGYQVGCGMMVGAPYQTTKELAKDMQLIEKLQPHMVGLGPFLPQQDTPMGKERKGSLTMTLVLLSLVRLMCPKILLPATTALGTLTDGGRELGILAGANVVMPNLSPLEVRDQYKLYDDKLNTGAESAEHLEELARRIEAVGYHAAFVRGDYPGRHSL